MKSLALRLIGHRHDTRFTWGELSPHFKHPKLALEYCPAGMFSHNTLILGLFFFTLYIHLPTSIGGDGCMRDKEPTYGFYTIDRAIVWRWGSLYKSFDWPFFSYRHQSTEVLTLDRKPVWIELSGNKERRNWSVRMAQEDAAKAANCFTAPYLYHLKNGQTQERTATVSVGRIRGAGSGFCF